MNVILVFSTYYQLYKREGVNCGKSYDSTLQARVNGGSSYESTLQARVNGGSSYYSLSGKYHTLR